MDINYNQAGPFRAGVVRYGWTEPTDEVPVRFMWAYQLPPAEAANHDDLQQTLNWVRIATPGWYMLTGTGPEDVTVHQLSQIRTEKVVHTKAEADAIHDRTKELRLELERARAAGFKV